MFMGSFAIARPRLVPCLPSSKHKVVPAPLRDVKIHVGNSLQLKPAPICVCQGGWGEARVGWIEGRERETERNAAVAARALRPRVRVLLSALTTDRNTALAASQARGGAVSFG